MTTAALAFSLILACIALVALIAAVLTRGDGDDPRHDDEQGGDGGSDRLPRRPLTPPGAGEPAWWPQFERDLADYVAGSRREGAPLREPPSRSGTHCSLRRPGRYRGTPGVPRSGASR